MNYYRALNPYEIENGIIISKAIGAFLLPASPPLPVPCPIGETEFMAIYKHQYGEHYETSGISVTMKKNIAVNKYGQTNGVVVTLCHKEIKKLNIKALTLKNELSEHLIRHPEDDEAILITKMGVALPPSIVIEILCSNTKKLFNVNKFKQARFDAPI